MPAVPAFLEEFARERCGGGVCVVASLACQLTHALVSSSTLRSVLAAKRAPLRLAPSAASKAAQAAQPAARGSRRGRKGAGRRAACGRRGGEAAAASAAPAADAKAQVATVLSVILGVISNLGGDAAADQPFMEAGIDSLGTHRRKGAGLVWWAAGCTALLN